MILPRFEAHVDLNFADSDWGVKVDSGSFASFAQDSYFLSSKFVTGSTNSLIGELVALLSAVVANTTITQDPLTGIITIHWGSGSHTLTFASSVAAAAFGFDSAGPSSSGATIKSDRCPSSCWLPNRPCGANLGPVASLGGRDVSMVETLAQSGQPYRTTYGLFTRQRFVFEFVTAAKVWKLYQGTYCSFEQFWESYLAGGDGVFRYYPDAAGDETNPVNYSVGGVALDYVFWGGVFDEHSESMHRAATSPGPRDTNWSFNFDAKLFVH